MSNTITKADKWFYFPVRRQGKRFVEAPESLMLGVDRLTVPELDDYLNQHHKLIKSEVELSGGTYFTYVYVPIDEGNLSYVIANSEGIPKDTTPSKTVSIELFEKYLFQLYEKLSYSEGIAPEQMSYLETQFMVPTFSEIDPSINKIEKECSWEEVLRKSRAVLIGEPGAGKTTCLRKIALEFATRRAVPSPHQAIPVYVQLREWGDNLGVIENVRHQLFRQNADWLAANVEKLSKDGRLILILDGLDELPTNTYEKGVSSILEVAKHYPRLGLFVSTRNTGYNWHFPGFSHLEINPFSESKVKEWVCQRLYNDKNKSWKAFYTYLCETPDLLQLSGNPLMLSIAVYLYRRSSLIPKNKATLLGKFIEVLVELWDSVRGVTRSTELWASPPYKIATLCRSAYELSRLGKRTFSSNNFLDWEKGRTEEHFADKMLPTLMMHTGLVRKQSDSVRGEWYFAYSCVTDYLAARYLVQRTDDLSELVVKQLGDRQWQDIWLYACGITQDATHLIRLVLKNENLGATLRASLLAEVFSQNISLNQDVLKESCVFIISTLEDLVRALKVNKQPAEQNQSKLLWSITFYQPGDENWLGTSKGAELRQLLRSIYKARSGLAQTLLTELLLESNVIAANEFGKCLCLNGLYEDELSNLDKETLLTISIQAETPDT